MIPRIQVIELNSITAATAWKEYAHMLSKQNLQRISDAGLMKQNNMSNSIRGLNKKVGAKIKLSDGNEFGTARYQPDLNKKSAWKATVKAGTFMNAAMNGYRVPAIYKKAGSYSGMTKQLPIVQETLFGAGTTQMFNTKKEGFIEKLKDKFKAALGKGKLESAHERALRDLKPAITAKSARPYIPGFERPIEPRSLSQYKQDLREFNKMWKSGVMGDPNTVYVNRDATRKAVKNLIPNITNKDFNKSVHDIIHHDLLEGLGTKTNTYSKNTNWYGKFRSHVHPNVLVREAKKYNQTGGAFTRGQNFDVMTLRDKTGELAELQKYLKSSDGTGRLRNRDYKKTIRDWERDNK